MEALNHFKPIWNNAVEKCLRPSICSLTQATMKEIECLVKSVFSQLLPEENENAISKILSTFDRPLSTEQLQKFNDLTASGRVDFLMNQFNDHALEDPKITKISEKISEVMHDFYTQVVNCRYPQLEGTGSCILNEKIRANCPTPLPVSSYYDEILKTLNQEPVIDEMDYRSAMSAMEYITKKNEASSKYYESVRSVMNVATYCIIGIGILVVAKKAMNRFRHLHQE